MELHEPGLFPFTNSVDVLLELEAVEGGSDFQLQNAVVSKEANLAVLHFLGDVVYVHQKENGAQDGSLGNTRNNWGFVLSLPLNDNSLGATAKEAFNPLKFMVPDSVMTQLHS